MQDTKLYVITGDKIGESVLDNAKPREVARINLEAIRELAKRADNMLRYAPEPLRRHLILPISGLLGMCGHAFTLIAQIPDDSWPKELTAAFLMSTVTVLSDIKARGLDEKRFDQLGIIIDLHSASVEVLIELLEEELSKQ